VSEETVTARRSLWSRIAWIILIFFCALFFMMLTQSQVLFELPIHFGLGWLFHAWNTFPGLMDGWRMILVPTGCLVLGTWLCHRFIVWCIRAKKSLRIWRPANTLAVVALLMLGSGAAVALSGIVHQGVWLLADPWVENRGKKIYQNVSANSARQLLLALHEFQETTGRYPYSFEEMGPEVGMDKEQIRSLVWIQTRPGDLKQPFLLLYPGSKQTFGAGQPVIVSPEFADGKKVVVGYGDSSVTTMPQSRYQQILEKSKVDRILEKPR